MTWMQHRQPVESPLRLMSDLVARVETWRNRKTIFVCRRCHPPTRLYALSPPLVRQKTNLQTFTFKNFAFSLFSSHFFSPHSFVLRNQTARGPDTLHPPTPPPQDFLFSLGRRRVPASPQCRESQFPEVASLTRGVVSNICIPGDLLTFFF